MGPVLVVDYDPHTDPFFRLLARRSTICFHATAWVVSPIARAVVRRCVSQHHGSYWPKCFADSWLEVVVSDSKLKLPESSSRLLVSFSTDDGRPRFTDAHILGNRFFGMTLESVELNQPVAIGADAVGFPRWRIARYVAGGQVQSSSDLGIQFGYQFAQCSREFTKRGVELTLPVTNGKKVTIPLTQDNRVPSESRKRWL